MAKHLALLLASVSLALVGAWTSAADFDSNGVNIHYTISGKGEPVILIHGLYASATINWELPGIVTGLAKDFRVIALDCRGHGQSGKPDAEGDYGAQMAEDVVRLMDHLHIAKARVAGYSMGGMITMKLLTLHPERVRAAVVCGMGWHRVGAPLNQIWDVAGGRGTLGVPAACLRGFPALAVTEREIKAVSVPVTIIVGDRDPCRRLYVAPLARARPDWPVHLIKDAGHLNCIIKPEFKMQLRAALLGSDDTPKASRKAAGAIE